jgi:hypothetical protein
MAPHSDVHPVYQSAQGDHGALKRKSVTPVTAFSPSLHLL